MPLEELKSKQKVIGWKQVKKALAKGEARKVFLASDAEPHIVEPIKKTCQSNEVEYEMIDSMECLGKSCGIDVGSAMVALLKSEV